jgi:hypothetical protein
MKKCYPLIAFLFLALAAVAQDNDKPAKKKNKPDVSNRTNDHIMIQFGIAGWNGTPDTINQTGFSKSFNAYFLFDFPFKSNPHISIALGAGVSTDHILFSRTYIGIKDQTPTLHFTNQGDTNHYKKTKLATAYLEAPLELRYSADPVHSKGFKFAVGIRVGTMINAHTRSTKFQTKSGAAISEFTLKESSKRFFNKNRLSVTGRIGLGHISVFGTYQLTSLIKEGGGPQVKPYSVGITLSGL